MFSKRRYRIDLDHVLPNFYSAYRRVGPFWFYVPDTISSTREHAIKALREKLRPAIYFDKEGNSL